MCTLNQYQRMQTNKSKVPTQLIIQVAISFKKNKNKYYIDIVNKYLIIIK